MVGNKNYIFLIPQKHKSSKREPTSAIVGISNSYKVNNIIFSFVS